MVAQNIDGQISVESFDASGAALGILTVGTAFSVDPALPVPVSLVAQPNGGTLLWWLNDGVVSGALIAADGKSVSTPGDLFAYGQGVVTATFADGAFYILSSSFTNGTVPCSNNMVRIESDGTPGSASEVLPGIGYGSMILVTGAPDLRVVYSSVVCSGLNCSTAFVLNGLIWQKLTSAGDVASPPVTLTEHTAFEPMAIGFGDDTMIAFSDEQSSPGSVSLMHIGPSGQLVEPTFAFSQTPNFTPDYPFAIASRGSEIVAAWGHRLARIVPGTGP